MAWVAGGRINHHQSRGALHSAIVHPQWVSVLPDGERTNVGNQPPSVTTVGQEKKFIFILSRRSLKGVCSSVCEQILES